MSKEKKYIRSSFWSWCPNRNTFKNISQFMGCPPLKKRMVEQNGISYIENDNDDSDKRGSHT